MSLKEITGQIGFEETLWKAADIHFQIQLLSQKQIKYIGMVPKKPGWGKNMQDVFYQYYRMLRLMFSKDMTTGNCVSEIRIFI